MKEYDLKSVFYSMKEIIINSKKYGQKIVLVDDSDYDYLNQWKWCITKYNTGCYAGRIDYKNGKPKRIKMHRLILGLTNSKTIGEHADRNSLNNQRYNLRIANKSQNAVNTCSQPNSTSKYLGVCWKKRDRKWVAQITKDYKKRWIGNFDNEIDAARAYNRKAIELFGEFANTNKITA